MTAEKVQNLPPHNTPPHDRDGEGDQEKRSTDQGEEGSTTTTETKIPPGRSRAQTAVLMLALCMAVFLAALDAVIITTALPTIARE
ncbi:hypothetical protein CH063_07338, partial [Colletotrichum higginsianum]